MNLKSLSYDRLFGFWRPLNGQTFRLLFLGLSLPFEGQPGAEDFAQEILVSIIFALLGKGDFCLLDSRHLSSD